MIKKILALIMVLSALTIHAEDVLQVKPFHTTAGVTTNDILSFSFEMNNSSADIWAFQFDLLLPEGMTLDNTDGLDPFELNEDRCPFTTDRKGQKTWSHTVQYNLLSNGWYRISVFNMKDELRFNGNSGEILRAYFLTDENMAPGVYPIYVKGTVLTITGSTDIKPVESSSYVVIGNSPLKTEAIPDLSSLTGYIPSWVMNDIKNEINSNSAFVGLNLSGATSFGSTIEADNKNALFYVNPEADVTDVFTNGNVVHTGDNSYSCPSLTLTDGEYNFHAAYNMQGGLVKYDLLLEPNVYTTLCLPFALSGEQVAKLKNKNVTIEKFMGYDASNAELKFIEVYSTEANTPYLIKCNENLVPFVEIEISEIATSSEMKEVVANNVVMTGVFNSKEISSEEVSKVFVYDGVSDTFILAENGDKVSPFRAYIKVPAENAPSLLSIFHENEETTRVEDVNVNELKSQGVYDVFGRKVLDNTNSITELDGGIYIVAGKKVLVK